MLVHEAHADAPPEAVLEVWADVASWPSWDAELSSAQLDGPFATGSRGRLVPRRGRPSAFVLAEVDPNGRHVVDVALPLATLRMTRTVARDAAGSRVEHRVAFRGPLGGLFARVLGPGFARALPTAVRGVCAQAAARRQLPSAP